MTVETAKQTETQEHHLTNGMKGVSYEVVEAHLTPSPLAEDYAPQFFPELVLNGLGVGMLIGGALGLVLGYLLLTNVITVPGWEGMYSLGATAFLMLWMIIGVAVGMIFIGIGVILGAPDAVDAEVVENDE
jgi:hypothetical protein